MITCEDDNHVTSKMNLE